MIFIESSDKMRKGFTLIELLAVIVILAIIALITIPAVLKMTDNAKVSSYRRSIDLYGRAINTAIAAYKSDKIEKKEPYQVTFSNVEAYVDYEGNDINCKESKIYSDDTILLTECSVDNNLVYAEKGKGYGSENYYYYTNSKKRIKALLYIEAANNALQGKENIGNTCQIQNGNLICNGQSIEVAGGLGNPIKGTLTIKNNQVTSYSNLVFEDEKAQTEEEVAQVVDEQQINTNQNNDNNTNNQNNNENNNNNNTHTPSNPYITLVQDNNNNGQPDIGDKYTYRVSETKTFSFYVLSVEGDKVNLIMERNICENGNLATEQNKCPIAWNAPSNDNSNGPITAMQGIYNATKNWINVPNMVLEYDDTLDQETPEDLISWTSGYKGIIVANGIGVITNKEENSTTIIGTSELPLKARLPKYSEVIGAECTSSSGSCPAWLVNYLRDTSTPSSDSIYPDNETIDGIYGYWLLSSRLDSSNYAQLVNNHGYIYDINTAYTRLCYGIRPVITVPKTDL